MTAAQDELERRLALCALSGDEFVLRAPVLVLLRRACEAFEQTWARLWLDHSERVVAIEKDWPDLAVGKLRLSPSSGLYEFGEGRRGWSVRRLDATRAALIAYAEVGDAPQAAIDALRTIEHATDRLQAAP